MRSPDAAQRAVLVAWCAADPGSTPQTRWIWVPALRSSEGRCTASGTRGNCFTPSRDEGDKPIFFIIFVDRIFTSLFERPFTKVFEVIAQSTTIPCLYRACHAD
jgi:hypothetical protein